MYLPSVEFSVSPTSHRVYRCRHCINLENETQRRESFLKYKCLLQRLYFSEANYEDNSHIAYLMQVWAVKGANYEMELGAREMAQWLRALAVYPKTQAGSIPTTHVAVDKSF